MDLAKSVLEETLRIREESLKTLVERKVVLKFSSKSTNIIDDEIEICKSDIEDLKNKINNS